MLTRGALWLAVLLGSATGCASLDEPPLWYKPGGNYTTVEFNRDRDSCTRDKTLDPECMKAKGWVSVSPDRPAPTAPPPTPSRRGARPGY